MQDPPQHHGPPGAGGEDQGDGGERPPSGLRPPPGDWALPDSGSDHSLPQSKSGEFEWASPARPRSPWGLSDPYDNNEVTRRWKDGSSFPSDG